MTIEKGKPWGQAGTVPDGVVQAGSDSLVAASWPTGVQPTGGNLWRSLGAPARKGIGEDCMILPVDVLRCTVTHGHGESTVVAVAEIVIGSWFSRCGLTVITNVGVWGDMNIAPRAHPNDGEFDVFSLESRTSARQRIIARKRAVTGSHVPHPSMSVRRATSLTVSRLRSEDLAIDGAVFGPWLSVSVGIAPDFMTVVV